jgi:hypothetical protein
MVGPAASQQHGYHNGDIVEFHAFERYGVVTAGAAGRTGLAVPGVLVVEINSLEGNE